MALCDALEQEQTATIAAHQTLVEQLLAALTQGDGWERIATHFDTLFTTENSIDQLKQTILQLAVMGKLVPQNPNDEPASVLLDKIAAEKAQLIKAGKLKKEKPLPPITNDEKPFELPNGWEWVRLGNVIALISGQHLNPDEYFESSEINMIPYISGPADFGKRNPEPVRFTMLRKAIADHNDILLTVNGSGVGKLNINHLKSLAIGRQIMAVRAICIHMSYLYLWMQNQAKYFQLSKTGIAIPGIAREDVLEAVLFMPPLAEQQRIVAKVDELMALCDALKAEIRAAQTTQLHLTDALTDQCLA